MEHYKSTLATAAIAAFGLLTAAHILHPGNFERTTYPARRVADVATSAAWVNPPAPLPVAEAKAEKVPVAWTSAVAPIQAAPAIPAQPEATPAPRHQRKAAAAQHRKIARRHVHQREATLDRPAEAAAPPAPAQAQARKGGIDPIGDIIRGLGLGSDS